MPKFPRDVIFSGCSETQIMPEIQCIFKLNWKQTNFIFLHEGTYVFILKSNMTKLLLSIYIFSNP